MKHTFTLCLALLCNVLAYSQSIPLDSIFSRMEQQAMLYPSEKVYLHTDRSVYMAGDDVWLRAYVVDAITHIPLKQSRYVYVALQNPFSEVVSRICLRADEDGYIHGNVPLSEDLPKGEYTLVAYTRYIENAGPECFFRKRIVINSVKNRTIRMETSRRGDHLDIVFRNPSTQEVMEVNNCVTYVPSGEINVQKRGEGHTVKFHNSKDRVLLVQAGNYKEFVFLDTKPDYEVSFLPEGGNLVVGVFNRIAFKCINTQGQGEDIFGSIRDERDSILLEFSSLYRGMGSLSFIPEVGRKYVAVCENEAGLVRRFPLPMATDGYSLQVNRVRDKFFVKVLYGSGVSATDRLLVLSHQKGWPIMAHRFNPERPTSVFDADCFVSGTVSFLLMTEDGRILNERMAFVTGKTPSEGILSFDKPSYGKREKMVVDVEVKGPDGKPWSGDCSLSVTDNRDVLPDSCNNILSTLLLESDLRGHIESPAWYFQAGSEELRLQALDVLMMTQGWRRYDLERVWQGDFLFPSLLREGSQSIVGKVTSRVKRKPVGKAKVQMMLPRLGDKREAITSEDGRFYFDSFEYPDSTLYFISAYTDKGKDNIVVEVDSIVPPVLGKQLPPYRDNIGGRKPTFASSEYIAKADLKFVQDKGMRHYFMDEVIVTASKKSPRTQYEKLIGAKTVTEEKIKKSGVKELLPFLTQNFPSTNWIEKDGSIIFTIRGGYATVIFDGSHCSPWDPGSQDFLKSFLLDDVAQIDIVYPPYSLSFDPKTPGGIIAITTKAGEETHNAHWYPTNLKTTMPLGFQLPVEFYAPKYELAIDKEKKELDLRTTIHWQPRLKVKDGKAKVEFYTADNVVDYSIVIEGVGEDGSLLRVEGKVK